jgi:hypothetical protein
MHRSVLVGLAAVVLLAIGVWVAVSPLMPRRTAPPPTAAELANPGDDVVARAMASAKAVVDSTEIKQRWQDDVAELALAQLSAGQREVFLRHANTRRCSCGCGFTLAACRVYDSQCDVSGPRIAALFDSVRAGRITSAHGMRTRPENAGS